MGRGAQIEYREKQRLSTERFAEIEWREKQRYSREIGTDRVGRAEEIDWGERKR